MHDIAADLAVFFKVYLTIVFGFNYKPTKKKDYKMKFMLIEKDYLSYFLKI